MGKRSEIIHLEAWASSWSRTWKVKVNTGPDTTYYKRIASKDRYDIEAILINVKEQNCL